jgi:pimeloyl-ACP methyl ester carboxylesterase
MSEPDPIPVRERKVMVGGVRLATAMNDAPRALYAHAPLIVLPEIGFVWQDYLSLLERFAATRRVFALDWPGFGGSGKPGTGSPRENHSYNDVQLAETLGVWIDSLGIGRAVLLGCGVSALPAIRYAAAHPRRTLGLALIAPAGFLPNQASPSLVARILSSRWLMRRLEGYVTSLLVGPASNAPARAVLERHRLLRKSDPSHVESIRAFTTLWRTLAASHSEIARLASTLTVPTMVLRGSLDPLVTDGEAHLAAEVLAGRRGGALTITLPEAGHLPFLQQPERFEQAISGLLEAAEMVALETPSETVDDHPVP